ncbi:hypothetical protein [Caloramator mitchellensis]|nr:hypothetical protein [Caloramator mitchellensis]
MKYILYIISVALITMVLIYVGYIKESLLPKELINVLLKKSKKKILSYLQNKKSANILELQDIIKDVKGRVWWSKRQVKVTEPEKFVDLVIDDLYKNGLIKIDYKGGIKVINLVE